MKSIGIARVEVMAVETDMNWRIIGFEIYEGFKDLLLDLVKGFFLQPLIGRQPVARRIK